MNKREHNLAVGQVWHLTSPSTECILKIIDISIDPVRQDNRPDDQIYVKIISGNFAITHYGWIRAYCFMSFFNYKAQIIKSNSIYDELKTMLNE